MVFETVEDISLVDRSYLTEKYAYKTIYYEDDSNGIIAKECTVCENVKYVWEFFGSQRGLGGVETSCKKCSRRRTLEYFRNNREKCSNRHSKWRKTENGIRITREHSRIHQSKRRSLEMRLRFMWDSVISSKVLERFEGVCALTGNKEWHWDHAVPLSIGHGGSFEGNMYPLAGYLNISKNNQCLFDWFDANKERFNIPQQKFDELIEYLAELNGMTTQEYEDYVRWCHDNPRTVEEIEAEKQAD